MIKRENENMSRKNEPITVESLNKEISTWVEDDKEGNGAWNMFTLFTLKDMQRDYDITMQYLSQMPKEHFDFVCEAIEEVVYHFQRMEMVELIETLYHKFYGDGCDTEFYCDNIKGLRNCIKSK